MTGIAEIERDMKTYTRSLIDGDYVAGARIEKKYGLYGATPEYVSTVLAEMADERAAHAEEPRT